MQALRDGAPIRFDKNFEMPSIPAVLTKIIQVLDDNNTTAHELEDLILHDPSLSARTLKLANSAFYSFCCEVKTLSHAITLLGMNLVKSLAIGVNIFESFTKGLKSEASLIHKLWMHSFGVAILAQEIWTRRTSRKEGEFAFMCGLLHDLGKVVFFKTDTKRYAGIFAGRKEETNPEISILEAECYGIDHATIGSMLAKQWNLPPALANVIQKHHAVEASGVPLVAAVCLADAIVKQAGIGYDGDNRSTPVDDLLNLLHMSPEEYERLLAYAGERRKDVESFFALT
jgi:putative nucleotidyltransferase with HDIG domain